MGVLTPRDGISELLPNRSRAHRSSSCAFGVLVTTGVSSVSSYLLPTKVGERWKRVPVRSGMFSTRSDV